MGCPDRAAGGLVRAGVWVWVAGTVGCAATDSSTPRLTSTLLSWCDEELCDWTVEAGSVERVPTWHEREFGAELRGELTVLSSEWTPPDGHLGCFEAALTSRRLEPPLLEVELGPIDDGEPDVWEVPPADYEAWQHRFEVTTTGTLEIRVTKQGGVATLAYLTLTEVDRCSP